MIAKNKHFIMAGLGVSLLLAVFLSPFASSSPDGLERVAEDKGFLEKAEEPSVTTWNHSPMPDYAFPGVGSEGLATALAGLFGTAGIFALTYGLFGLLKKRKPEMK